MATVASNRFKSKSWLYAFAVFAFAIAVIVGGISYIHRQSDKIFRDARNSFERDLSVDLPSGSTKLNVQQFLDRRAFAYKELGPTDLLQFDPWYKDTKKTIQGYSRYIEAPRPICRIFVEFKFNENEMLIDHRDHLSCKEVLF